MAGTGRIPFLVSRAATPSPNFDRRLGRNPLSVSPAAAPERANFTVLVLGWSDSLSSVAGRDTITQFRPAPRSQSIVGVASRGTSNLQGTSLLESVPRFLPPPNFGRIPFPVSRAATPPPNFDRRLGRIPFSVSPAAGGTEEILIGTTSATPSAQLVSLLASYWDDKRDALGQALFTLSLLLGRQARRTRLGPSHLQPLTRTTSATHLAQPVSP